MRRIVAALAVLGLIVGGVTLASASHWPEDCAGFSEPWDGTSNNNNNTFGTPGLGGGWCIDGRGGSDQLIVNNPGRDRVYGSDGNDTAYGGPGNDDVVGGAGQDTLKGEDGNDHIYDGEATTDTLYPGAGFDVWHRCEDGGSDNVVGTFEQETSITQANCDFRG